jgi:lipopolysaccharide export system permease protein
VAETGKLEYTDTGPKILLKNGTRQVMNNKTGQFSSMTFDDYAVDFSDMSQHRTKKSSVREKSIRELFDEAKRADISVKEARVYLAEANRRILAPFFNLVFALLACTGLLIANFNRRGQGKVVMISILAMMLVQVLDMSFSNMARKHIWIIGLMYANCILTFLICMWLLIKTPVFRKRVKKETTYEA